MRWLWVAVLLGLTPLASADQLAAALDCAERVNRLERLACYDGVFGAPSATVRADSVPFASRSERWRQAFAQAGDQQAVVYRDTGKAAGHLVTVSALGVQPPRPLLMVQCHNNITELAVLSPHALVDERISVNLGYGQADWRVRANGFLVSAGRGLPAIRTVKALAGEADLTLFATNPELDGLMFDLSGFHQALSPLRAACGW